MVWAAMSKSTSAKPVPGEALGGLSLGPFRLAVNTIGVALAAGVNAKHAAKIVETPTIGAIKCLKDISLSPATLHDASQAIFAPMRLIKDLRAPSKRSVKPADAPEGFQIYAFTA